ADPADDANEITDYIQDAYDTWNPAPSYVLLVGDSEFIPTHYRNPHPAGGHGGFNTPTDLFYVTVDETDYFPDIFIGRLSVDTPEQACTVIGKILDYECRPPNTATFYSTISACAQFEDEDVWSNTYMMWFHQRDGFENKRFVLTSEEIRDYLTQTEGYTVERIYWARDPDPLLPDGQDPTNYNDGPVWFYDDGDPLPTDLLWPGFTWNGNTGDITSAINDGRFLIYHRDHGSSGNYFHHSATNPPGWFPGFPDGWSHPRYTTGDIAGLANGQLLPVVFSLECQCGWFDGEIDQLDDPDLTNNFESFCEEFLRQPNGGAIGTIGSTRNSYSGYNDELAQGLIDAIWPGFDPNFASGGLFNLGPVLTYGKIYMTNEYGYNDEITSTTFELFHLFGDPEMSIWTRQPKPLTVTHPSTIGSGGPQEFVVKVRDGVNPVLHALVCLRKDTDVYTFGYTNAGGHVIFNITPSTGGNLDITVTKHNYLPYEGVITVTNGGAVITELLPDFGAPDQPFKIRGKAFCDGETVNTYFDTTFLCSNPATDGKIDVIQSVPSSYPEGPANVIAIGECSGRAAVKVFTVFPPQPPPDPYIYCQWDSSTWHLNPSGGDPVWNNPCIQLYEESTGNPVSSGDLQIGTTYTIEAEIHNSSVLAANGTEVTFTRSPLGIGQPHWEVIGTKTVDVPAATGTVQASVNWTPILTGHCCIVVEIYHPLDSNLSNNKGQENCDVQAITSPTEIFFDVHNPTDTPALVNLEVTQSDPCEQFELWGTRIERPYPQVLEPNDVQTATLRVLAPEWADIGESRTISVTGTINGEIIGGIEFQVVRDHPPVLTNCYVDPSAAPSGTSFAYWVKYTDEDDYPPIEGHPTLSIFKGGVPISGSPFEMIEEDSDDTDCTDGKIYARSITLLENGNDYTYCFWARDSLGIGAEGPATNVMSGPSVMEIVTDSDGDGVLDGEDNCPDVYNPDQTDTDLDGIGNACESISHWDFDGDVLDSEGINHLSNHGATFVEGKVCQALDFDGVDDHVERGICRLAIAPGSFTIFAWVKPEEVTDGWRTILEYDRYDGGGPGTSWFGIWLNSNGNFHLRIGHPTTVNSITTLEPNKWYLLTATYNATDNQAILYINGAYDNSAILSPSGYWIAPADSSISIGRRIIGGEYFNGVIDEVMIFNRVLRQTEINKILGKPTCWCANINPRQCHGDADGKSQGKKKYWVSTNDLDVLIAAWNKPFAQIKGQDVNGVPLICADFDHLPQGKKMYRV
ncbi:MAG: hypothetical protein JSV09_16185, partial [Thermoplasmata archaeon]